MKNLSPRAESFLKEHEQFLFDITCELGKIPAPSHHEEKRAEWCKAFLEKQGAEGVFIDEALNVVWPIGVTDSNKVAVVMAHIDVVFPDTEPLPMVIEDGLIKAPGIGDDTANVAILLLCAKYLAENKLVPKDMGVVLVMDSCEEGLGNLKGCRAIMERYKGRVAELTSFDGGLGHVTNDTVGSERFRFTIGTEGGHSYGSFGNRNAIHHMASLINTLYTLKVPPYGKTTYNVGMIEGGTSINTVAQHCSMMYEFRSNDQRSLALMHETVYAITDGYAKMGINLEVELLGVRPCRAPDIDMALLGNLTDRAANIQRDYGGLTEIRTGGAGSTDANIPLSMGIPAVCFGLIRGKGAHTREEYIHIDSLAPGAKIGLAYVLQYFND